jgi:putative DNA methylase
MTDTAPAIARPASAQTTYRKKLIEVTLPLDAINEASAREKSIRHGHPSTLHLWWARRPLATCRAVLFAQLVDDPSSVPEEFPTDEAQEAERERLFVIIRKLVQWENSTNEAVLLEAQREIARSVARTAGIAAPRTKEEIEQVLREHAPPVLDPFCGGGSIPLEAQRLGLEAHASDLNPVAVLITKAMIEIPPKFKDQPPVNPEDRGRLGAGHGWKGAAGLAADVRYYGKWMREEAEKRIGHLYPKVKLPKEQGGGEATVIAWLWARTVRCPNPACGATMPLVHSFALSTKKGKEAWVEPVVDRMAKDVHFGVKSGLGTVPRGTVGRTGARCVVCGTLVQFDHVRAEGRAGHIGQQLMAVVAEGQHGRAYISPSDAQDVAARQPQPEWSPSTDLPEQALGFRVQLYGMTRHADLFTPRQLIALSTFSDLVGVARARLAEDCADPVALPPSHAPLGEGDLTRGEDTDAYADAVATYLALTVGKSTDYWSNLCIWRSDPKNLGIGHVFARQALQMVWDFAEGNPFSVSSGNWMQSLDWVTRVLDALLVEHNSTAVQKDARQADGTMDGLVSTDPPYYDNIGYADLSDFFYVWLRHSLRDVYPDLFRTMLVPKEQELIATPYRFDGSKQRAQAFFEDGLGKAFDRIHEEAVPDYPVTIYYAFKQAESDGTPGSTGDALVSSGWDTMLTGLLRAGFAITGTWPMRSELGNRMRSLGSNALASSIVLVCRPRAADVASISRREFLSTLRGELPAALTALVHGNIAPVDLAQASIGPGMAIFSRYASILEADGSPMSVRTALGIINSELDRYFAELEGQMDADTRFCVSWYEQYQYKRAKFGEADVLARAKNTSVNGLERAGVLESKGGDVRLLERAELDPDWQPLADTRPTTWEDTQHLITTLQILGEGEAGRMVAEMGGSRAEDARALALRMYGLCDRKGWAEEAGPYNELGASWSQILIQANDRGPRQATIEGLEGR